MRKAFVAGVLCAGLAAGHAAAQTRVEAVQYPAWLERGGQAAPLVPGTALQASDTIRTGENARVRLRLAEGSAVKLGENARFVIERASPEGDTFRGALAVLAGAFRFTTARAQRRDLTIKVKNVTAGIRGTDLWGKSAPDRDFVVLIEGRITMESAGHPAVVLEQPLDLYQRVGDAKPEVVRIEPARLEELAKETELPPNGATASVGGEWRVVAAVLEGRDAALALQRVLRAAGYPTEVAPREGRFAVQIPGLAGEAEARALMGNLRSIKGVTLPHVQRGR